MASVLALLAGCKLFRPIVLTIDVVPSVGGSYTVSPDRDSFGRGEHATIAAEAAAGFGLHGFEVEGQILRSSGGVLELALQQDALVTIHFWAAVTATYSGAGSEWYLPETEGGTGIVYRLDVGSVPRDVYFAFTNVGSATQPLPTVSRLTGDFGVSPARSAAPRSSVASSERPATAPIALRGNPLADAFYEEAERIRRSPARAAGRAIVEPPPDTELMSGEFCYDSVSNTIQATCRVVVGNTGTGKKLSVWVADESYGTGGDGIVTQDMVDALAAKFLAPSGTDDIYSWVRAVFGDEWAAEGLDPDYDIPVSDTITILLYDIEGDGATVPPNGGLAGFFWAKDNYLRSQVDYSNERLMFYIDAPMLAYVAEGETAWSLGNYWPREMVSTLAHEFQHMIHYYQKQIRNDAWTGEAWLNEMCSMVAEDLLADKLQGPGPRGVEWTDGSAGSPLNTNGYLPYYVYDNFTPVAYWPPSDASFGVHLASYATNYAYGAYLARNFGGAGLFTRIVQSGLTGSDAIDQALTLAGYAGETFSSALRKWTIAALLSDGGAETGFAYNTGTWIPASGSFQLGSINLYNYRYDLDIPVPWDGPYIWSELPSGLSQPASSSYYYAAATGGTGTLTWQIGLEPDTRLQVVVKSPQ